MFRRKKDTSSSTGGLSVALIGCGPAGMSVLHALQVRKNKLDPKSPEYKALPEITCYERAESAGGIWRDIPKDDKARAKPENKTVMYDELWCNQAKELMEYFDYTWDEHFKKPSPAYITRKDMLEYLIARNSADGALDGVKFNHTVQNVQFNASAQKFTVTVQDDKKGKTKTNKFDRVIWSGGINSTPEKPADILELMAEFSGKVMHACEAAEDFEKDVKGKKIMLIGDSSSAEDLALRAVKLGCEHVTICSRSGDGDAFTTGSWPQEKVKVIYGPPYKCMKGKDFKCQGVYWSEKRQKWRKDDEEEVFKVKDIDTVVLCTGYEIDFDYLDMDLRFDDEAEWQISKGWLMDNNSLTISVGNVTPSKNLEIGATVYPDVYRCLLISNPKMMFLTETDDSDTPIIDIDVDAWLILGYLTGEIDIPKDKDMQKANQKQLEAEMQIPWLRESLDNAYADELDELDDNHWSENPEDERSVILEKQQFTFKVERLARDAKSAKYPVDFGKEKKLNTKGKQFADMMVASSRSRTSLEKNSSESSWRTFRDAKEGDFVSIHTGTPAAPLPGHWIDLNISTVR